MQGSEEARPSGSSENCNKPDISRLAAWLLDGRLEELGWADRLMHSLAGVMLVRVNSVFRS
jgi:hypothetical protein